MAQDHAKVVVRPPLLWFLTIIAGIGLNYRLELPFMPAGWPNGWIGGAVFLVGLCLAIWAFRQFGDFRTDVDTHSETTRIVSTGAFSLSRNPIYLGMLLGLVGLAIAVDTLWLVILIAIWLPLMRWGVIAPEETYLEAKFGEEYRTYKSRVRRWI